MSDRTVHATYPFREIVRYDRAGKWYLEPTHPGSKRLRMSVTQAAKLAVRRLDSGGQVFFNRPGGQVFDKKVRDLKN